MSPRFFNLRQLFVDHFRFLGLNNLGSLRVTSNPARFVIRDGRARQINTGTLAHCTLPNMQRANSQLRPSFLLSTASFELYYRIDRRDCSNQESPATRDLKRLVIVARLASVKTSSPGFAPRQKNRPLITTIPSELTVVVAGNWLSDCHCESVVSECRDPRFHCSSSPYLSATASATVVTKRLSVLSRPCVRPTDPSINRAYICHWRV